MFQQTIGIPMGTIVLRYSLIYSIYLQGRLLQGLYKNKDRKLIQTFNFSFRFIDDLSLNNSRFGNYLHLFYTNELRILLMLKSVLLNLTFTLKSTTEEDCKTTLYDKRDALTLPIVNYLVISSNIPASPAYGAYISQCICYSRGCV